MKKLVFAFALIFTILLASSIIQAAEIHPLNDISVYYFYRPGCEHCANVEASGILDKVSNKLNITIQKLDVSTSVGADKFNFFANGFNIPTNNRGTPTLVIQKGLGTDANYSYLEGDKPIINNLESSITNFSSMNFTIPTTLAPSSITPWAIILGAAVDSVNPCAFGVLIFLMVSLLKIGSSKRALKAGLLYTFVVFAVYFLVGLGIFRVIQSFTSITHYIYISAAVLVLVLGLWQFKDVLMPHIGPQLRISSRAKPLLEKIMRRGTLTAIVTLGILVSIFELPCTGGIYLAILTMMSKHSSFAWGYLLLYNFIFVLPLIILTLVIYKGANPERIQKWTSKERTWMKLASGIMLIVLGLYLLLV